MPAWKVLVIGFLALTCLALGTATALMPMSLTGNEMWGWMGGLGAATLVMTVLFVLFLRHTDKYMEGGPLHQRRR